MSDCSCPLSALTRTLDHKLKGIRSLRILGHQLALILIRRFLLWLESGKDPSYQLRSWKGTEASGSRLPSTCPPVFFTSSSAIFTPTKDYLSRTPKEVTYIDEKTAERTTKKLMYCAELRNPSPQKQTAGHSAPTAGSMPVKILLDWYLHPIIHHTLVTIMEFVGEDILLAIFSFLDVKALCIGSQVCHQWNEISNSNILWKSHVRQLCNRRKISAHLGRAEDWKSRFAQLFTGRLYPRSTAKTEKKLSFDTLTSMLVPVEARKFVELTIKKKMPIRDFVESQGYAYKVGKAFYQHTKSETISMRKKILLQAKVGGQLYEGNVVRQILGLTKGTSDWNIQPSNFDSRISESYRIFVQSTSVNRTLVLNTILLYQND